MLDITAITDALTPNGEPVQYRVAPEKLLAGDPLQTLTPGFTARAAARPASGKARRAAGGSRYRSGILRDPRHVGDHRRGRQRETLRAGHRFVIPPGFRGTWEVVERTRKIFVAYEAQPTA